MQGNSTGLVYTDLIEKCYLTLTQVRISVTLASDILAKRN
jgi:hypothetical protein